MIFGPALVAFWRGTWDYLLLILDERYESDCTTPNVVALALGLGICIPLQLLQFRFRSYVLNKRKNKVLTSFVTCAFSVVYGAADIYYWKGLWDGVNCWCGTGIYVPIATAAISALILGALGFLRSGVSAPLIVAHDSNDLRCRIFSLNNTTDEDPMSKRLLDMASTVGIEALVILIWHGVWTLTDMFTEYYEMSHELSAWFSTAIGFVVGFLLFITQFALLRLNLRLLSFGFALLAVCASVQSFRGYWFLLDVYFIPDSYEVSLLNGQAYGGLILLLIGLGPLMFPGVVSDRPGNGDPTILPSHFFTHWWIKVTLLIT